MSEPVNEARAERMRNLKVQIEHARETFNSARRKLWDLEEEHDRLQTAQRLEDFRATERHGEEKT